MPKIWNSLGHDTSNYDELLSFAVPCHCSVGWLLLLHVGVEISYVPNTSKTKSMLIHSRRKVTESTLELSIEGTQAEQVHSFKFLGVTVNDSHMVWPHYSVCAKVSRSLNLLRRLSLFLPQPLLLLVLKSYILPLFNYCDMSGPHAPNLRLQGWRPSSTMTTALPAVGVKGPLHQLLVRN